LAVLRSIIKKLPDDVHHLISELKGMAERRQTESHEPSDRSASSRARLTTTKPEVQRIGRYEVLERIARGSLTVVYRAYDRTMDRTVAVKTLLYSEDEDVRTRFLRELRAVAGLRHPNIISMFELGEHEGRPYVATEFVDGENLAEFIGRRAPVSLATRLQIAGEICAAFAYLHGLGLIHREFKPSSVLLGKHHQAKILNVGLTQTASVGGADGGTVVMGTPQYQSPEQLRGEPVDHRTDIFSFGAVLYELISYRRAFTGTQPIAVMMAILNTPPQPLHEVAPGLDPTLEALVDRCLQKDPKNRYQDVVTLSNDLEQIRSRPET